MRARAMRHAQVARTMSNELQQMNGTGGRNLPKPRMLHRMELQLLPERQQLAERPACASTALGALKIRDQS
jgi:hypothetical protein